jgi:hypothetical protein
MIIVAEVLKMTPKAGFFEFDDVIEALAAVRSDQSFHVSTLLGRARCRKNFFYAHGLRLSDALLPKDAIAIT